MAWAASLTRECALLAGLWSSESQSPALLEPAVLEAISLPKTARKAAVDNEDAFMHFSVGNLFAMSVFDGHGGSKLSRFMKEQLPTITSEIRSCVTSLAPKSGEDIACLDTLFPHKSSAILEERLLEISSFPDSLAFLAWLVLAVAEERAFATPTLDTATAGGCVSLVFLDLSRATASVAWLGDSSVLLLPPGDSLAPKFRSQDHRIACRPDERVRVETAGGRIFRNRAVGVEWSSLGVTRAFGDTLWKIGNLWSRDGSVGKSGRPLLDEDLVLFSRSRGCTGVSGIPELAAFPVAAGDCLVVASDGLWDLRLQIRPPYAEAVRKISVLHDDTTVIAVELRPIPTPNSS